MTGCGEDTPAAASASGEESSAEEGSEESTEEGSEESTEEGSKKRAGSEEGSEESTEEGSEESTEEGSESTEGSESSETACETDEDCASDEGSECGPIACVEGACVVLPVENGTPCTLAEAPETDLCFVGGKCTDGECAAEIVDCDDGDPCTSDLCNGAAQECIYTVVNSEECASSQACDASTPCPQGQYCADGTCAVQKFNGEPCSSDEECSGGVCNGAGLCSSPAAACSSDEDCDDGNSCTVNACGDDGVCAPVVALEDGTSCGTATFCSNAQCVECLEDANCQDGNECTVNTCTNGFCEAVNAVAGQLCNGNAGTCDGAGACAGETTACESDADCDDGNACTTTSCTDGICTVAALEGESCGEGLTCFDGVCAECVKNIHCNDGNECTFNACADGVCETNNKSAGFVCGGGEGTCDGSGVCAAATAECTADEDCDDANPCTVNTCEGGVCQTEIQPNSSPCGALKSCFNGNCQECLNALQCNDFNACTEDTCSNGSCSYTNKASGESCLGVRACAMARGPATRKMRLERVASRIPSVFQEPASKPESGVRKSASATRIRIAGARNAIPFRGFACSV